MTSQNIWVRWMLPRDQPKVLEIERRVFEFPWKEEDLNQVLDQRQAVGMIAELDEEIVGSLVYLLRKRYVELLTISVQPEFQRMGVGLAFMEAIKKKMHPARRQSIFSNVRERNLNAQLFFQKMGFRATEIIRGCYDNLDESAYRMRYVCPERQFMPVNRVSRFFRTPSTVE